MLFLNKILNKRINLIKRFLHGECLRDRSLIKVSGNETKDFLQGLMTNDMEHLTQGACSMYTMFLNVQGRVLFDSIVFKTESEDSYIIDCDSQVLQPLINHMKLYKVRRKIDIKHLKAFRTWAIFDGDIDVKILGSTNLEALYLSSKNKSQSYFESEMNLPKEAIVCKDPRLQYFGDRIILPCENSLQDYSNVSLVEGSLEKLRYQLGIGEGASDLIRGKSLPLESNCDYLHGVSFQKGCYIGQELTARTYHTGIIRKRIMPLILEEERTIEKNSPITNEKGRNVGKVINISGQYGIGLLRIEEALKAQTLSIGQINVTTFRPGWWPIEAPKDRHNLSDD